jgi:hypothetical protein
VQEALPEWQSRVINSREETDRRGVAKSVVAIVMEEMTEVAECRKQKHRCQSGQKRPGQKMVGNVEGWQPVAEL